MHLTATGPVCFPTTPVGNILSAVPTRCNNWPNHKEVLLSKLILYLMLMSRKWSLPFGEGYLGILCLSVRPEQAEQF